MSLTDFMPKFWLTMIFATIISGCSNTDSNNSATNNSNLLLDPMAVSGTAAWGAAAQFAEVCTINQISEFCTRADESGNYILRDMSSYNSLIKANIIDGSGIEITYYSLYEMPANDINAMANINSLTDIITQAYLADTGLTASQCYATASCTTDIQENLNTTRLNKVIAGMQILLGDLWPRDNNIAINPFTETYIAYPSSDPINTDALLEMLDFNIDNTGLLTVSSLSGPIANIPLSQLALSQNSDFLTAPALVDTVDSGEALAELNFSDFSGFTADQSPVSVSTTFIAHNQTVEVPVGVTLEVQTSVDPMSDYITNWTAELYGPDGSYYTWYWDILESNPLSHSLILEAPGEWNFSATATSLSGIKGIGGRTFRLGSNVSNLENATWGNSGRCTPVWSNFTHNSLNLCLEQLDGGKYSTLPECNNADEFKEEIGRCSIFNQFQDDRLTDVEESTLRAQSLFLGHCSNLVTETRYYHYINPLTYNSETFAEAESRASTLCINSGGSWNAPN